MNLHAKVSPDVIPAHIDPSVARDYDVYEGYRFAEVGDLHEGLYRMGEELG